MCLHTRDAYSSLSDVNHEMDVRLHGFKNCIVFSKFYNCWFQASQFDKDIGLHGVTNNVVLSKFYNLCLVSSISVLK